MSDTRQNDPEIRCEDIEQLAVLYACDELDPTAREKFDAHVSECPACAAALAREGRLQQAIASLDQPADSLDRSGLLLAQGRSELAEALDDQEAAAKLPAWRRILSPGAWWSGLRYTLIYHPALSMAVLVVAGFLAGVEGQRMRVPPLKFLPPPVATVSSTANPSATPKITDEQLRSADNARVAWVTPSDSRTPAVQVDLMSPTPLSIVGPPDDADVRRALTFVLENSQRFDPDARLDSLDVLRGSAANPEVRQALCAAARLDHNPGVRVKALEALQGFEQDAPVRQVLLDALESDASSGVRIAAINLLLSALRSENGSVAPDPQMADVLRDRIHNDPNVTVRQQSAAALRGLGAQ